MKTNKVKANTWAPHEELALYDAVTKAQAAGKSKRHGIQEAAKQINRTEAATAYHWYSELKAKVEKGEFKPEKVRAELAKKPQAAAPKATTIEVVTTRGKRTYNRRKTLQDHLNEPVTATTRKPAKPIPQVDVSTMTYRDITNLVNKLHKVNAQQSVVIAEMKHALGSVLNTLNKLESQELVAAAK